MYTLRKYRPEDWDALCYIHDHARLDELRDSVDLAAFLPLSETAESEGLFSGELWVCCEDEGKVTGFVAFTPDEISWLYVDPARYGKGIGRMLLKHAIRLCGNTITTEALSGNKPAIQLYLSEGFRITAVKKGKLTGNEKFAAEGVLMKLEKENILY